MTSFTTSRVCAFFVLLALSHHASGQTAVSPDKLWRSVDQVPNTARAGLEAGIRPKAFRAFTLDAAGMQGVLGKAPREFTGAVTTEITLPKPDGTFARFRVEEVALMEPGLAARYPGIRTYRGRGIDDPTALLHLDVNAKTFHAQVLTPSGTYYIDPYWRRDGSLYMSYYKRDLSKGAREFKCLVGEQKTAADESDPETTTAEPTAAEGEPGGGAPGQSLRTYRLACATSMTYSQYHGGTVPEVADVLAALVTMNNRVSGVYETELGVRMVLVDGQEEIIASAENPTPYTDNPGDIGANPAYLDLKIGAENYDIGHVVTTGSGGIAGLGVVCRGFSIVSGGSDKASGTTGINPPEGDGFWIDFVAHEMGHQFGGNHTFDGDDSAAVVPNCGANQNESTAYEPGGGSTIQAYAGICNDEDLQPHSDPYFHFISLTEMFGYITSGIASRPPLLLQRTSTSSSVSVPLAPEAAPGSGTLNPTGSDVTWEGTATGGAALDDESCLEGATCDTYVLTLSGTTADWENKTARITFNWPTATDDYDIYVRKGAIDGPIVDDAASANRPEIININPAARDVGTGQFYVRVVYFSVVPVPPPLEYQYTAVATVIDQSNPPPAPTCALVTATGNNPPIVNAGADYKIPARTPFALTASATDAEGDVLTYCWEEADLWPGPKVADEPDDGQNPIIRSYPPTTSPTRIIPRLQELLNNQTQTRGEKLPTTNRELNFLVTARDNVFGGFAMDSMKIDVIDSGQGFAVTSPNTPGSVPAGTQHLVSWDVANSTGPEINTTHVNIWLSLDGGNNFNILLLGNTPNDGSQPVPLPFVATNQARVKVEAVGNIYFDISNTNFTITAAADSDSDGMPDAFESANDLNPNDPADALLDNDGDGQTNRAEFVAGTGVNDPNSVLRIIAIGRTASAASVTFTTVPGRRYRIQTSPNLTQWNEIPTDLYPSGNTETFHDSAGGTGAPTALERRFYRAVVFNGPPAS